MRFVLALLLCSFCFAAESSPEAAKLLAGLPLRFEPNTGAQPGLQSGVQPSAVRWLAHGQGYSFAFGDRETRLAFGNRTVRLTFPGAKLTPRFQGENQQ